ncbi:hypothetical protein FACS189485_19860 [Spirochaetia bacterium]|nr:hypothetical protein FACS189485_19860 [Spirochaetia bacterium]
MLDKTRNLRNNVNMNRLFGKIAFILYIVVFYSSCYTTAVNLGKFRNDIIKKNPNVKLVGFVPDQTFSDNKYLEIEIIFDDGRHLYLTYVNWINRDFPESPFQLARIGNYGFTVLHENIYGRINLNHYFPVTLILNELGIPITGNSGNVKNISILINNYDNIYEYIDSLPDYNDSFLVKQEPKNKFITKTIEIDGRYEAYTIMKNEWNDKYFYSESRKPDFTESDTYDYLHWLYIEDGKIKK